MGAQTGLRESLFNYLGKVLPASATQLVSTTMFEVSNASGGGKIAFGILAALWAASNGMGAITEALNIAYDVKNPALVASAFDRDRINLRAFGIDHHRACPGALRRTHRDYVGATSGWETHSRSFGK